MPTRILLADDHRVILSGLQAFLNAQPELQVVGVAIDGRIAVDMAETRNPDVVVMDVAMPELNGIEATRRIVAAIPNVKVICLSAQGDRHLIREALKAGAKGFVAKTAVAEELLTAIQTAMKGEVYLSPATARLLVDDLTTPGQERPAPLVALSNREREVLQLIAEGKTTKGVAARLQVSVKTAETHRRNLMEKLNMDSVADLTKLAIREGLTTL